MTIGIDTVWLQLLSIPDIVSCISHPTCWEPQLAECGALRDRIPHQGRSHQMQKNNNKHNNKQWATIQKCTKIDYGVQTRSKNYQGGYKGRHGMPEAISKGQCSPLHSVQMTLSICLLLLHPLDTLFAFLYCILQLFLHFVFFSHSLCIPVDEILSQRGTPHPSFDISLVCYMHLRSYIDVTLDTSTTRSNTSDNVDRVVDSHIDIAYAAISTLYAFRDQITWYLPCNLILSAAWAGMHDVTGAPPLPPKVILDR